MKEKGCKVTGRVKCIFVCEMRVACVSCRFYNAKFD